MMACAFCHCLMKYMMIMMMMICVASGGSVTLGCAAVATSANSKPSASQSACDAYLRRGSCLELRVLDAGCP